MLINTILVDDEPIANKMMALLLEKHCPQVQIQATFTDPAKALKAIRKNPPQLLFLDIEMPGMNGFDLLQKLKTYTGSVVFVTAYSQYAIRAFKFSALDYLLKPVNIQELKDCVTKCAAQQLKTPHPLELKAAKQNIHHLSDPNPLVLELVTGKGVVSIQLSKTEVIEAQRSYSIITQTGNKDLLVSKSSRKLEEVLPPQSFIRLHKSYIVNLQKIKKVYRSQNQVEMQNGKLLHIGRAYRKHFIDAYNAFLKSKEEEI